MAELNIFQREKLNGLLREGKMLFRSHKPDMANLLQMEDKHIPLEDVMSQVATLHKQFTDEELLELVDHDGQYYLRYLVRRNIEARNYLNRAAELLREMGAHAPQVHMIIIKNGQRNQQRDGV